MGCIVCPFTLYGRFDLPAAVGWLVLRGMLAGGVRAIRWGADGVIVMGRVRECVDRHAHAFG